MLGKNINLWNWLKRFWYLQFIGIVIAGVYQATGIPIVLFYSNLVFVHNAGMPFYQVIHLILLLFLKYL